MKYNNIFETRVTMYVYEEIINNEKLTNIINTIHENVKYLPGHKLPENVASILNTDITAIDIQYRLLNQQFFGKGIFKGLINNCRSCRVEFLLEKTLPYYNLLQISHKLALRC